MTSSDLAYQIFCQFPAALQSWRSPLFMAIARMSILGDHASSSQAPRSEDADGNADANTDTNNSEPSLCFPLVVPSR